MYELFGKLLFGSIQTLITLVISKLTT